MQSVIPTPTLRWDIFCRVIDNFGDIGVCWRLACHLAQRGQSVRLWVDDASALTWMAPQGEPGVQILPWTSTINMTHITPGDVMVEAFGCEIATEFIATYADYISARGQKSIWINLEYLSAENFTWRCHGLPSPVMSGPGTGLAKHFFYPGFVIGTGGLLRESNLLQRQSRFDRTTWLAQQGLQWQGEQLVSLFCYEPAGLNDLLDTLAQGAQLSSLLVTAGRAAAAMRAEVSRKNHINPTWNEREKLSIFYLTVLSQQDFDHLLWASDVNFVRGEDSLVRALWAGKPFVWQIYPQDDGAHEAKLDAFLDWLEAPASMREFHRHWNGLTQHAHTLQTGPTANPHTIPSSYLADADWCNCAAQAKTRLLAQDDLTTQLLGFAAKKH